MAKVMLQGKQKKRKAEIKQALKETRKALEKDQHKLRKAQSLLEKRSSYMRYLQEQLDQLRTPHAVHQESPTEHAPHNAEHDPTEAYCVRCKTMRRLEHPEHITLKNGRPALRGTCIRCGATMQRFLPSASHPPSE